MCDPLADIDWRSFGQQVSTNLILGKRLAGEIPDRRIKSLRFPQCGVCPEGTVHPDRALVRVVCQLLSFAGDAILKCGLARSLPERPCECVRGGFVASQQQCDDVVHQKCDVHGTANFRTIDEEGQDVAEGSLFEIRTEFIHDFLQLTAHSVLELFYFQDGQNCGEQTDQFQGSGESQKIAISA